MAYIKTAMFNIRIPKPCHEDWNAMAPTQQGAFCTACSKEVVDFTKLTDEEVQHYFQKNTAAKTCGRFRTEQVDSIRIYLPENILIQKIAGWKKFMAVLLLTFSSMLFGCDVNTNMNLTGAPVPLNTTQINTPVQLLGDTSFISTSLLTPVPAPDCHLVGMILPRIIDSVTENNADDSLPVRQGEIEFMPIVNINKPDDNDSGKVSKGEVKSDRKDSTIKRPVSDTSKCNDTGYY